MIFIVLTTVIPFFKCLYNVISAMDLSTFITEFGHPNETTGKIQPWYYI